MSTPRQRRRFARTVIIALVVAWIVMLVVIGADLVELKLGGPPRLTPAPETTSDIPSPKDAAQDAEVSQDSPGASD